MPHELTVGSLFSGIGGMELGLERAGMRCLWQCEIDPYAVRVLEKHWPDVLRLRDVRDVGAGTVPPVDLICGGFPCQDISVAGKGAGLDGERSGLWSEMLRVVRDLRPRYVLVENVPALLARGVDRVLGDLAESGYDAEWDCIRASDVGAPHRRDRIWIVAYPQSDGRRQGRPRGSAGDGPHGQDVPTPRVADPTSERREQRRRVELAQGGDRTGGLHHWAVEPDVGRVADGIPARMDRLRGLGNAVVPQVVELIGRRIIDYERGELSDAA